MQASVRTPLLSHWGVGTHVTNPSPGYQQKLGFERGQAFRCIQMSLYQLRPATASPRTPQIASPEQLLHGMTWTEGRVGWKEEGFLHLTMLLTLSVLEIGGPQWHPSPQSFVQLEVSWEPFWGQGDKGASLDLGKRTSWSHHSHHSLDLRSPWKKEERDL